VRERELQCGNLDRRVVPIGDPLDTLNPGENLWRRLLILEVCTAREDAGTIRAAHDDVAVLGCRFRHHAPQRALMIQ
jgi:hypothetical protein